MRTRRVIGAMTGTSIDGIDLALVEITGDGLEMRARLLRGRSASLGSLAPRLRAAAEQQPLTAQQFAALARELGELHAREAKVLAEGEVVDLISAHGQTIFHAPPLSWQLLDPWPIASLLGCRVICDLRKADLAAGGEGAPLTPLSDWILYRGVAARAVLNLGGFANATALPADLGRGTAPIDAIRGADLCVCNQLLDRAAQHFLHAPFDTDGAAAARGRPDPAWRAELTSMLVAQRRAGRSLGTGDEAIEALARFDRLAGAPAGALTHRSHAPEDALATIVAALGDAIATGLREVAPDATEVIVAGGGARHRALVRSLADALGLPVTRSDDRGLPGDMREAVGWAVLGALAEDGIPISLPRITHRAHATLRDGLSIAPLKSSPLPRRGSLADAAPLAAGLPTDRPPANNS